MFAELFILAICLLFYSHYNKRKHLPPGPISVPFIGSLISKGFKINREEFYKYGDMYSIFLGQSTLIIINDMKRTKDLFKSWTRMCSLRKSSVLMLGVMP